MKRFPIKAISILVVVAMLAVSSLPARPLLAAEARHEVSSDKVVSSAQDLAEAEVARALAFDSQELRQMRQLTAAEGLQLRTDRQPLVFLQEENGQRLYTADRQAVLFLGEKAGRRIYQVFLGLEESPRFPKRPVLWPVWEKEAARETSLVFAFVDVASQAVLDVVRMDIGSVDRDGAQKIVMRNAAGRTVKLQTTSSGVLREVSETSHEDGVSPVCPTKVVPTEMCTGAWLCWLVGWIACTLECTAIWVATALVGGIICAFVCEAVFTWICSYACD